MSTSPESYLSTSGALSQLRLSRHVLDAGRRTVEYDGRIIAVDLVGGFYLFRWPKLSSLSALPGTFLASDVGATHALDDSENLVAISPGSRVFAALATLPMGWSWALYFCHSVVARAMVIACQRAFGLSPAATQRQLVVDGRPPPAVGPRRPT